MDPALDRTLAELATLRLPEEVWAELDPIVREVEDGVADAPDRLAQATFEARVRFRFRGPRGGLTVVPTKKVSVLPWVGLVCGGLLLAVGGALGGGLVFAGVAALSAFVFVVAFAGSRVANRPSVPDDGPALVPIPDDLAIRVHALRARP